MGTAAEMLAQARKSLGMSGRPNTITREYAGRHGSEFLRASWCDMAVTYWARHSGNAAAVLLEGDRAYTVWHAEDFQRAGRWKSGSTANVDNAKPGDIVFFDWGATDSVGAIDHVGVIEKVLDGGRVQTIEGNTGDACKRRVRAASVIAGYGRPAYGPAEAPKPPEEEEEMRYYGQLAGGPGAVTPISVHPGDVTSIGFVGDNGIAGLPPARLRVAVHDAKGWYAEHVTVDSAKPKPWLSFRDAATTDGISVQREDDGAVPIAWDAS